MRCPDCQHDDTRVIDSRSATDGIRRRRACTACNGRFTTWERIEQRLPWVVKRDGRKETFQRDKVHHGIALACRKLGLGPEVMEQSVSLVEQRLVALRESEVPASKVGDIVMEVLRDVDPVAYVRFASVYGAFDSVEQFAQVIAPLQEKAR